MSTRLMISFNRSSWRRSKRDPISAIPITYWPGRSGPRGTGQLDLARNRRLHSLPDDVLDLLESRWADPSATAGTDRGEALHRCLGRLAAPARELLEMKYADGLTAGAIANKLRRTTNAIYQNLCRIHRSLRDCVEQELTGRDSDRVPREVPS